jgi:hypothetical protein
MPRVAPSTHLDGARSDSLRPGGSARSRRIAIVLCVLAALRMLLVVGPAPMRGYGNNYDFLRVSASFDLWPAPTAAEPGLDPRAQHPQAPLRCYRVDPSITTDVRYPTSEVGFVWLAVKLGGASRALTGDPCDLDLRVLGLLRAAILLAAGAWTTRAFLRRAPRAGVASAAILAFVLADPAVTLLFNTLYSEFSTILFTYLACAQIVYLLAFGGFGVAAGLRLGATLLALAGSKTQFAGLSLVLLALLAAGALARSRDERRGARLVALVLAGLGATAGLVAQQRALGGGGYMWAMRMGAATDTFFGAILPLHRDPDRALALVGLPASCRPYVGNTWYDAGMQPPPCPAVADVSRVRILRLLIDDPGLAVRLTARSLPLLQPLIVRYYGQVEGEDHAQADARWSRGAVSVSALIEALPVAIFAALLALTVLAAAVAAIMLAWPRMIASGDHALLPLLVLVAGVVEVYAFASSLFGAGFIDLGRHAIVGQLAFLVLVPAGTVLLADTGRRLVTGR